MTEADRALLPLRLAVGLFIIQGVVVLVPALFGQLKHTETDPLLGAMSAGVGLERAVSGTLSIAIGIGILLGKKLWRTIGAVCLGAAIGFDLAGVVFGYWPLGPAAWDGSLFVRLVALLVFCLQFWAITNAVARSYCTE